MGRFTAKKSQQVYTEWSFRIATAYLSHFPAVTDAPRQSHLPMTIHIFAQNFIELYCIVYVHHWYLHYTHLHMNSQIFLKVSCR